jgi:phage terminase large subunit-like protein
MLTFGLRLRLGNDPRAVVTTTPEPIKIIRELIADPNHGDHARLILARPFTKSSPRCPPDTHAR